MVTKAFVLELLLVAPVLVQARWPGFGGGWGGGFNPWAAAFEPWQEVQRQAQAYQAPTPPPCQNQWDFFVSSFRQVEPKFEHTGILRSYRAYDTPFSDDYNAKSMQMIDPHSSDPQDMNTTRILQLKDFRRIGNAEAEPTSVNETDKDPLAKAAKLMVKPEGGEEEKGHKKFQKEIFNVHYINMEGTLTRERCLNRQMADAGVKSLTRYPAVVLPDCTGMEFEPCLKEKGYGDCVEGGLDYGATQTHGSTSRDEWAIRAAVVGNWCGHKRLWKKLEADKSDIEYFMAVEDDVILDRKWFREVVEDFLNGYKENDWDMLQLDPFGKFDSKDLLGHYRGKPVWRPAFDDRCSQYWGFQAVIVKKSALPRINQWMSENPTVPIDWLPFKMPNVLAWSSLVAKNPEASGSGKTDTITHFDLPAYCADDVRHSSIG